MRKIKVLRIINRFNLGGPTYNAAYLTRYMSNDFETLLIGGQKYEEEASSEFILENLGIKPVVIPEMQRNIDYSNDKLAYEKIKQIIKEFNPDIVHTHASKAGTLGRLAARKMKVPVVVHTFHGHVFHSYFGKAKTLFYKNVERYLAKSTDKIIAISEIQKEELVGEHKICKDHKMEVVPLGFDLNRFQEDKEEKRLSFRTKYLLDTDEIAIGIIGRLVPIKNHEMFFDVVERLMNSIEKNLRFFVIGDGEEKDNLKEMCTSKGLSFVDWLEHENKATVTFTSWIKNIDWANAGLDIITLTSLNEGTPVSLIEAQASGKPIVTTNCGGVKNVTIENETTFITDIDDVSAFTGYMTQLINNEELRSNMGAKGWDHVSEKFSYTRLVRDVELLYKRLLQENKN